MAGKSRAIDKNMSKLGNRLITTMLKNEKLAEKELDRKMKAIKYSERKSMVKICETSLDMKYDMRRKRNTQDMEEQIASDSLNAAFGQGRVLRSPSISRRGSYAPISPKQDDADETASVLSLSSKRSSTGEAPEILINNERKETDSDFDPESRRSSVASQSSDAPLSDVPAPADEPPAIDDAEAQKMLNAFSQSTRGSHRRRTAPEITDLSPKLLIQLAKSSAEVRRRGSTMDGTEGEMLEPTPPASSKRRGSATAELMQSKAEAESAEGPVSSSPILRRRGSAAVGNSSSQSPNLRRRGSAAITKSKNVISLELNEAHLRGKISEQAPLPPRLKQPLSPLLGRRGSGVAASLRPTSGRSSPKGSHTDSASEQMLPELNNGSPARMRRSLSPGRQPSSINRPSTARSLSSLSADSALADIQLEASSPSGEYDLTRRRGSRPGSSRSCYSMPPGGLLLPIDRSSLASRRGSDFTQIDLNTLSPSSPLRKAMEDPQATLNPAPVSPSVYRRHSGTVEALQDRVDDFLKTLAAKSS